MSKKTVDVMVDIKGDQKDLDAALRKSNSSLKNFKASAISAGKQVAILGAIGVAAVAGLTFAAWKLTSSFKDYGVELDKVVKSTGLSANLTSQMAYAAEQEHASLQDLQTAWRKLSKTMSDADEGLAESIRSFDALGVSIYNNKGGLKSLDEMTLDIADALSEMTDDTKKAALAQEMFGRSGMNMIPFLEMGSDGIRELMQESVKLGNVWTNEMAAGAKSFDDKLTAMSYSFRVIKWQIGNALLPEFEKITDWFMANKDWIVATFTEIFDIDTKNIGADVVNSLEDVKTWIETNKEMLGSVWDGLKTSTDMVVTSIKVLYASMAELYAFSEFVKSGGGKQEWANLQTVSASTAGLYQDIGQKSWAQDIAGAFAGGDKEDGYKPDMSVAFGPLGPYARGAAQIGGERVKQEINVRLDGSAVMEFLTGRLVSTTNNLVSAGT